MCRCIVCKSIDTASVHHLFDDRYGYPEEFELRHCRMCRHLFLKNNFEPDQLIELYTNYYPRSDFDITSFRPHTELSPFTNWLSGAKSSAFRWVPENVRVLDIGCGFCRSLGYHANRGCDVYGVEADENVRHIAKKHGYKVHIGVFEPEIYETNYFDYVTMDQVLEHMTDPVETLRGVEKILKPGGIAVITFPNAEGWGAKVFGKRWIHWHVPYHLQFFSKKSIEILANNVGMNIIGMKTISPSAWLHYQWNHLLMYPKKSEPSKFWSGLACGKNVELVEKQVLGIRVLGQLNKTRINHLVTRLFDYIGLGDNRIVFLRKP